LVVVRHLWGLASVAGLLVLVSCGLFGLLTAFDDEPTGSGPSALTFAFLALSGGVVVAVGVVARGDGSEGLAKARRILGGVGLFVTPVAAALCLLNLGTAPSTALVFLLVTVAALVLWVQAIALQSSLPFGVSSAWLALAGLFAVVVFPIALAISAGVGAAIAMVGAGSTAAAALGSAAGLAFVGWILSVWAGDRTDRRAVPGAVRRAVFGRALPADVALLTAGPAAILRGQPAATAESEQRATSLAALDRRLRPSVGDLSDVSATSGDLADKD
jgi:hypothetical protein